MRPAGTAGVSGTVARGCPGASTAGARRTEDAATTAKSEAAYCYPDGQMERIVLNEAGDRPLAVGREGGRGGDPGGAAGRRYAGCTGVPSGCSITKGPRQASVGQQPYTAPHSTQRRRSRSRPSNGVRCHSTPDTHWPFQDGGHRTDCVECVCAISDSDRTRRLCRTAGGCRRQDGGRQFRGADRHGGSWPTRPAFSIW